MRLQAVDSSVFGFLQRLLGSRDDSSVDACPECGEPTVPGATRCEDCLG